MTVDDSFFQLRSDSIPALLCFYCRPKPIHVCFVLNVIVGEQIHDDNEVFSCTVLAKVLSSE